MTEAEVKPLKVLQKFKDKYTGEIYEVGRVIEITDPARVDDLVKRGLVVVIPKPEPITEPIPEPKHIGGGYYELPDGTRIQGKANAIKAVMKDD